METQQDSTVSVRPPTSMRSFADDAESALDTGRQVIEWWKAQVLDDALDLVDLKPAFAPYFKMQSFFDSILIVGDLEASSAMGCMQQHRFKRRKPPCEAAGQSLETFIDERFLKDTMWTHPDGLEGGFRYRPVCCKDRSGHVSTLDEDEWDTFSLARLRNDLEWIILRVDILDFVRSNPSLAKYNETLSKFMRESAYIVLHEDLAVETTKKPKGVISERRFGYSFLKRHVEPNMFGFGPGNFGTAVKQWKVRQFANGDVELQVAFIVTPRSEKTLDINGFDPVYASVHMADAMSMGKLGIRDLAHDSLDSYFMTHHGTVHADVVNGLREIWEGQRWVPNFGGW